MTILHVKEFTFGSHEPSAEYSVEHGEFRGEYGSPVAVGASGNAALFVVIQNGVKPFCAVVSLPYEASIHEVFETNGLPEVDLSWAF